MRGEVQEATTGHEDKQATATGQERTCAGTGDNEQAPEAAGPAAKVTNTKILALP